MNTYNMIEEIGEILLEIQQNPIGVHLLMCSMSRDDIRGFKSRLKRNYGYDFTDEQADYFYIKFKEILCQKTETLPYWRRVL